MSKKTAVDPVPSKIITSYGYSIDKSAIDPDDLASIKSDLTMEPKGPPSYQKMNSFPIYAESRTRIYLPRAWAEEEFGHADANWLPDGIDLPASLQPAGKPYDYQENIIQTIIDKGVRGLLCVPCGKGKTFMALHIAGRLRKRFLVVVDKEFLLDQWKGEIANALPGARVGIVRMDKAQTDPALYDITICMIQTLCQRQWSENFFAGYGLTIFDECHHLGAAHFSRALMKVQTPYMLGLSATPQREDGLTKVFEAFLGKPIYWEKQRDPDESVVVRGIHFSSDDAAYNDIPTDWKGDVVTARLLTQLVTFEPRNKIIINLLKELISDSRRYILVLSERKSHLECIEEGLISAKASYGYYIGGMKQTDRDTNAADKQVLLATYAMASDALNIKKLNCVILASPRKNVEQSTGRILRQRPEERQLDPLIVDVIDSHGIYQGQWRKRTTYYKKCKYTFKHEYIGKKGELIKQENDAVVSGSEDDDISDEEETKKGRSKKSSKKEETYEFLDE
jgi:superfamily II DNA or RNA helicase